MNSRFRLRSFAISIVLGLTSLIGTAQAQTPGPISASPEPDELRKMREQFALRALAAGRTLADQYANALASLEAQAIDSADYETAHAAQQRRQELADFYSNPELDPGLSIVLKPSDAKTIGAVTLDQTDNVLTNWRTAGSSALWDISKITPGNYEVSITCSVADSAQAPAAAQTGGEIEFGEVTSLAGTEAAKLTLALKSTGSWSTFETFPLGDIKLGRTSARFAVRASRLRGAGGLMHLKEIRLSPARPTADPPDLDAAKVVKAKLEEVRAAHQSKLRELEQPVLDAHLAKLAALGISLASRRDEDGMQAVAEEGKRAQKMLEKPDKIGHPPRTGLLAEGLEEVRDAAFVENPGNTGDRFLVKARGETFFLRLMFVSCPLPAPDDTKAHDFHRQYFGITEADSLMIGRQARDFTAAYLKDKPLKLITRWQKDGSGAVLATVVPAEIGDFAGILVDNGLAAVLEPPSKGSSQHRAEETPREILKQRERAAKARPVPPGAWSLAADLKPAP